jgi:hypothetical protein
VHRLLASLAVAAAPALALGLGQPALAAPGHRVFRFADPAIVEASDLVVGDGVFLTTNDSGDTGRVFAVDARGTTVGVSRWSKHPVDTEALAPGGKGFVWVGDIGDNDHRRASVEIARIPVGRGNRDVDPTSYRLAYPDGPTDAETLMRDPVSGRLYLATKSVFGGVLYAVPARLRAHAVNRLEPVGRVLPVATDGAFFPDGKHLVVRSYADAVVYSWPSMQPVGSFALPRQPQGEGIAVADDGRIYVSSEGTHSSVLRVQLPARLATAVYGVASTSPATAKPPSASSGSSPGSDASGSGLSESAGEDGGSRDAWPWVAGGLLGVVALLVLLRSVRPR